MQFSATTLWKVLLASLLLDIFILSGEAAVQATVPDSIDNITYALMGICVLTLVPPLRSGLVSKLEAFYLFLRRVGFEYRQGLTVLLFALPLVEISFRLGAHIIGLIALGALIIAGVAYARYKKRQNSTPAPEITIMADLDTIFELLGLTVLRVLALIFAVKFVQGSDAGSSFEYLYSWLACSLAMSVSRPGQ